MRDIGPDGEMGRATSATSFAKNVFLRIDHLSRFAIGTALTAGASWSESESTDFMTAADGPDRESDSENAAVLWWRGLKS